MSKARPVFNNSQIMLTRRVRGRLLLLRPNKQLNALIRYVVAVMAAKRGIEIHALTVLSNHWHLCLNDPLGNIVRFQRDCHSFIARGLNACHGEFESVWSSEHGSRVECEEPSDLIEKIAYTMANPVEAGLVRHGKSWPGVRHAWPQKDIESRRPALFFRGEEEGGSWPKTATLTFTRPAGYEEHSDDELAAVIDKAIETREERFRAEFDAADKKFLGRKRILAQARHCRPRSREPRFGISPKVACRNKERRIQRLAANKQWGIEYGEARQRWRRGDREVRFPHGTYNMRVLHSALCAPPPTT